MSAWQHVSKGRTSIEGPGGCGGVWREAPRRHLRAHSQAGGAVQVMQVLIAHGPLSQRFEEAAACEREGRAKLRVRNVAASLLEERVGLCLKPMLEFWLLRDLKQQPRHRVRSGVVTSKHKGGCIVHCVFSVGDPGSVMYSRSRMCGAAYC